MNDQKLIEYLTQKFTAMEAELKETKASLADLQSRPSPSTERELFLLAELDKVNLQLECKFTRYTLLLLLREGSNIRADYAMNAQVPALISRRKRSEYTSDWTIRPIDQNIPVTPSGQIGIGVRHL